MSNGDLAQRQVKAFEDAVEEYFLGAEESDDQRQRRALRDMARAASVLQALSGGSEVALAPLLENPNEEVRLMAQYYQGGKLDVVEGNIGIRGPVPESSNFGDGADEAKVARLVQTFEESALGMHAARASGDAKAFHQAMLGLSQVPFALMTMQPSRLPALAALFQHPDMRVRILTAATLSAAMPEEVKAALRDIEAAAPGTTYARQAAAVLQKIAEGGFRKRPRAARSE